MTLNMRRLVNFMIVVAVCVSCFMLGVLYQIMTMEIMPAGSGAATQGPLVISGEPTTAFSHDQQLQQQQELEERIHQMQNAPVAISDAKRTIQGVHVDYDGEVAVPPIVQAWRQAKVDWHDLIPEHNTFLEKFGDSTDPKFNFMKLVAKEEAITSYLTRYKESGLQAEYGKDHGRLLAYSGCNLLRDECMIHDRAGCDRDEFCKWDHARHVCVLDNAPRNSNSCPKPRMFTASGSRDVDPSRCSSFIHQPVITDAVGGDPASMFYHWWGHFRRVFQVWQSEGANRQTHFILTQYPVTKFFHYYGLMSDSCWRRASAIPDGVCFCNVASNGNTKISTSTIVDHMLKFFGIDPDALPAKPTMGLISRRDKRFLLNEHELVRTAKEQGFDVLVLPLEKMTLYEQLKALRQVTLLVGVHGSGLNNALFMQRNTVILQILTYNLKYKGAFAQVARENHVTYLEMAPSNANTSLFHWEFVGDKELKAAGGTREAYLAKGSPAGPSQETYMFWINQDMVVDIEAFKTELFKARRIGLNGHLFGYDMQH